jgi:hypothetical protein
MEYRPMSPPIGHTYLQKERPLKTRDRDMATPKNPRRRKAVRDGLFTIPL